MRAHLSVEDISRWMAGDGSPEDNRHLAECARCCAELARMETVLADFRISGQAWSARYRPPVQWRPAEPRHGFPAAALRWALVTAALALALAVPTWRNLSERRNVADARLWEQVNTQVSRPVPAPLEPLMKLMVWKEGEAQ